MLTSLTRKTIFGLILVCSTALIALRVADTPLDRLLTKLQTYAQTYPYEKVYLHTDRDTYLAGETVWLKSYLFYGENRHADSTSGSVMVDLISPNGRRILLDTRLRSAKGYGDGYLTLPDTLRAGRYTLRAYTGWMRNFEEAWYFNKAISVVRTDAVPGNVPNAPLTDQLRPDVQFLPEGGQMVNGINSRVAVKAVGPGGVSLDVEGFVLNAKKDTVAGFKTTHLGMGLFPMTPEPDQTYLAYARVPGTTDYSSYTLPAPLSTGYTLLVDNLSNKDNIRVFVGNNLPGPPAANTPESGSVAAPSGTLSVLAQVNGVLVHAAQGPVGRKQFMVPIPRSKCPEGIVQITLIDPNGKPVCERLAYSARQELISLAVTPKTKTVGNRQRVDLDITATDPAGQPVVAGLSLAVTDATQQPKGRPFVGTLPSYLLLTSDLTGYVDQPGYYFDPANKDRLAKLDLLLMTQGWRRVRWERVMAEVLPPTRYPVDPSLTLSGMVYRGTGRVPAANVPLTIMINRKDSTRDMYTASSDETGRFSIADAELVDTTTVYVQAGKVSGSRNFNITIDKLFVPQVRVRPPLMPGSLDYAELTEFLKRQGEYAAIEAQIRRNREVQLQTVVVRAKRADPYASQRGIFTSVDASIKVDDLNSAGAITIFDVIRSRVAGVQVTGSSTNPTVQIRGAASLSGPTEPLFMIDGMQVEKETVVSISPRDVAYIDVIKGAGAAMLGSRGAGGGINIIMKRGGNNEYVNTVVPGVRVEQVVGFAPKRDFYAPRYDKPTPEERVRPDYRATLLWSPNIVTGTDGKATVSFYTSDAKTALRMVLEGATQTGYPGHTEATMTVN